MPDPGSTYAEYATVPETEVARKPWSITHAEAASLPMVSLTAWRALFEEAGLSKGNRVLVHAAAGGVGHVAVQLASSVGAHVIGTASARNEDYLQALGVDEFVDYQNVRFESALEPVDVVLDAVGGDTLERSLDVVRRGGVVVTLPTDPPESLAARARANGDVAVRWFSVEPDRETLSRIVTRIEEGDLAPTVSEVYPLSEVGAAQERSESGHVRGKLVLEPVRSTG